VNPAREGRVAPLDLQALQVLADHLENEALTDSQEKPDHQGRWGHLVLVVKEDLQGSLDRVDL